MATFWNLMHWLAEKIAEIGENVMYFGNELRYRAWGKIHERP